jgi:integrase/recombinase XerD
MGKYFNQMKQDLEIRGYSSSTVRIYLDHMKNFIKFHMKSPEDILLEDITAYQVYLVYSKKSSFATFNLAVCSIKYFYKHVIRKEWNIDQIPFQKRIKSLPTVISAQQELSSDCSFNKVINKKFPVSSMLLKTLSIKPSSRLFIQGA